MRRTIAGLFLFLSFLASPGLMPAQAASSQPASQAQVAALQQAVQNAQTSGDNAWMLVSAALVLLMTGPGLALFYGGLVRKKNILGTMMQSFAMMCLVTILWPIHRLLAGFQPWQRLHRRLRARVSPERLPHRRPA